MKKKLFTPGLLRKPSTPSLTLHLKKFQKTLISAFEANSAAMDFFPRFIYKNFLKEMFCSYKFLIIATSLPSICQTMFQRKLESPCCHFWFFTFDFCLSTLHMLVIKKIRFQGLLATTKGIFRLDPKIKIGWSYLCIIFLNLKGRKRVRSPPAYF